MDEARDLRQQCAPIGRLVLHVLNESAPADLLGHPAFEIRFSGYPQVKLGIELAAEALDGEQRLLQHHELGLNLHVEAARRLKKPHQHAAERNIFERPGKDRLAYRADRGLEFVDARVGRNPA